MPRPSPSSCAGSGSFPGAPFVAHNASFDANFLARGLAAAGFLRSAAPCCAPGGSPRRVLPELRRLGLDRLTCHFGVVNRAPHRALGDAEATAEVLLHLLDLARGRAGVETLADLIALDGKTPAQVRKLLGPRAWRTSGTSRSIHSLPRAVRVSSPTPRLLPLVRAPAFPREPSRECKVPAELRPCGALAQAARGPARHPPQGF